MQVLGLSLHLPISLPILPQLTIYILISSWLKIKPGGQPYNHPRYQG
jgi:hypothetical protein